jgi:fructose-1,6-bisphosphatase/inositol monophosphatase family enzyme
VNGLDPQRVADLIREAADTIVLPRHRQLDAADIHEKQRKDDLVTIADIETEHWLTERLGALLPGSIVVGEEAVFADPDIMQRIASDGPVWIIDPVDGTWNFAHGKDEFAIIVALRLGGETVMGWIAEPALGGMAIGERGAGVAVNGRPVDFTAADAFPGPLEGTAARHLRERAETADPKLVRTVYRSSSAGHEYMLMLRGERHFSAYTRLLPWDHVAGTFLMTEAGGASRLLTGAAYDPAVPVGELLTVADPERWNSLCTMLSQDAELPS